MRAANQSKFVSICGIIRYGSRLGFPPSMTIENDENADEGEDEGIQEWKSDD